MKYLLITILLFSTSCLGQYPKLKIRKYDPAKADSIKYYRYKYLEFADSMNITRSRASARFEDSCEKYYKLLYRRPSIKK